MKSALFLLLGQFDSKTVLILPEICAATAYEMQTAYNSISKGDFPIPVGKQGKKWVADVLDVADWLDMQRDLTST
jgi:predicted DNA-binding transcriptional regulator AlpA